MTFQAVYLTFPFLISCDVHITSTTTMTNVTTFTDRCKIFIFGNYIMKISPSFEQFHRNTLKYGSIRISLLMARPALYIIRWVICHLYSLSRVKKEYKYICFWASDHRAVLYISGTTSQRHLFMHPWNLSFKIEN